jgi:calcineurin-like phosphoesterase family protein
MHKTLLNNFNAILSDNSILYVLGDVGMGGSGVMKNFITSLKGTKVLVRGNHDKGYNSMYNMGFDVVVDNIKLTIAGEDVTLSHCPKRGVFREDVTGMRGAIEGDNWHGESRETHNRLSVDDYGQFHLHGHLHAPNGGKSKVKDNKQWDIGIDGNNYRPVSISKIESWINKYKDGIK